MASRGDRLGSRIAYDNGGLMHNSVHTSGAEIAKNTSPQQSSGGATLPSQRLLLLCSVGVSLSARKPQY
jgi:hypothetical protein